MRESHRLVSSTRLIAVLTLLSRVLGLFREMAYSHFLGTGPLLSAFRIAFMIPNLSRRLFGEGALSAAFIPVFTRVLQNESREDAGRLAGGVLTLLVAILGGVLLAAELVIVGVWATQGGQTLLYTAIMLPFMVLICVAAFLGGVLQTLDRFAAPAASPALLNVIVIATIFGGSYFFGLTDHPLVVAMCVAVLLAGFAQVALQLFSLRQSGFRLSLHRNWKSPHISEILTFMTPMLIGLSTVQVNTLLDMLIAQWFVADGRGPAVLGYAHFMYQLPLGVFGIALATAIFPILAKKAAAGDLVGVSNTLADGLRLSFFIMLPATVGLVLVAGPMVSVLLEHGEFGSAGTLRVSRALGFYALGLCAYATQHVVVRTYYALGQSATPARVSVWMVCLNLMLNLLLVKPLGEAGVAVATATSAVVQVVTLGWLLRTRLPRWDTRIGGSLLRTVVTAGAMGLMVWLVVGTSSPLGGLIPMWLRVVLAVVGGGLVVFGLSHVLGGREPAELLGRRVQSSDD